MKRKIGYVMLIGAVCAMVLAGTALAGKPAGSGAGKAFLYNSNAFDCDYKVLDHRISTIAIL